MPFSLYQMHASFLARDTLAKLQLRINNIYKKKKKETSWFTIYLTFTYTQQFFGTQYNVSK